MAAASGKYGDALLYSPVGSRAMGLGGAYAAVSGDIQTIAHNPAGLMGLSGLEISGMHSERFAGMVGYDFLGFGGAINERQSFGIAMVRLGVDQIPVTQLQHTDQPLGKDNRVVIEREINSQELALMVAYAGLLHHPRFSYGVNIKVLYKNLNVDKAWGVGFDLGLQYQYSRGGRLGLILQDGTTTHLIWKGGRQELIYPKIKIGALHRLHFHGFQIVPVADIATHFDNQADAAQADAGRLSWVFRAGAEVAYKERLALRFGTHEGQLTLGAGILFSPLKMDYAFARHMDLGSSHLISMSLFWTKISPASFLN